MTSFFLRIPQWLAGKLPRSWFPTLYQLGPISSLIRWTMNLAAPEGFTRVIVASGPLRGLKLDLNLKTEKDMWLGSYEIKMLSAMEVLTELGMTAYDIGANIGYVSLALANWVGSDGVVYAIEPLPENIERLNLHMSINGLSERVSVKPIAIGGITEDRTFFIHSSGGMGKLIGSAGREVDYVSEIQTSVASLDDLVFVQGMPNPDLIKLDIEGGEVLAMPGMTGILENIRPIVFIEAHGPESLETISKSFLLARYGLFLIEWGYPKVESLNELGWKTYLIAFPAEREAELSEKLRGN